MRNLHLHGRYHFPAYALWSEDDPGCLSDVNGPGNRLFTWHYHHTWWYMHIQPYPCEAWPAPLVPDGDHCRTWHYLPTEPSVRSGNLRLPPYGAVFTAQGMCLDPTKIQTLQDLPTPNSHAKLQYVLGLINYLQPFIPSLSAKTMFLHEQLAKWDWNPSTDAAFQHWICQTLLNATLAYYDRSKLVVVQMDASEYGLRPPSYRVVTP